MVIGGGDRRERWRACRSSNCVFFGLFSKCLGALSLRLHLSLSNTLDGTAGSDQRLDDDTHAHTRSHMGAKTPLLLSLPLLYDSKSNYSITSSVPMDYMHTATHTHARTHEAYTQRDIHRQHWPDNSNCCL